MQFEYRLLIIILIIMHTVIAVDWIMMNELGVCLVPSPTPSFSSLAPYCKRRKAGRGTGNKASLE